MMVFLLSSLRYINENLVRLQLQISKHYYYYYYMYFDF